MAHEAGKAALIGAEKDLLVGRDAKESVGLIPTEYGGRICRRCISDGDSSVYSYYATTEPGTPRRSAGPDASGEWIPTKKSECSGPDVAVGLWHTHPSELTHYQKGKVEFWYWSPSNSFTKRDFDTVDGLRKQIDGKWKVVFHSMNNPKHLPVFVTYRTKEKQVDENEPNDGIKTDLYLHMPDRPQDVYDGIIIYPQ
ncbi:MAG: hypothetical protein K9N23_04985 [Akkermansiaceae bacterium]|nr:hypothetical protein [Akkermansiaceae bacterium]MCF7731016.1 hypothetical protein [Akkermansiaceae bacterium]